LWGSEFPSNTCFGHTRLNAQMAQICTAGVDQHSVSLIAFAGGRHCQATQATR